MSRIRNFFSKAGGIFRSFRQAKPANAAKPRERQLLTKPVFQSVEYSQGTSRPLALARIPVNMLPAEILGKYSIPEMHGAFQAKLYFLIDRRTAMFILDRIDLEGASPLAQRGEKAMLSLSQGLFPGSFSEIKKGLERQGFFSSPGFRNQLQAVMDREERLSLPVSYKPEKPEHFYSARLAVWTPEQRERNRALRMP